MINSEQPERRAHFPLSCGTRVNIFALSVAPVKWTFITLPKSVNLTNADHELQAHINPFTNIYQVIKILETNTTATHMHIHLEM